MKLESQELDKKEGDIAVLASLRVMHSIPSTSREGSRSSIKYQFGGMPICKAAFNALGAQESDHTQRLRGFKCTSAWEH